MLERLLGRAINREARHRRKREAGRYVHQRRLGPGSQVRKKGRRDADRAPRVGVDLARNGLLVERAAGSEIHVHLNAGIVDDAIDSWKLRDGLPRHLPDSLPIRHVESEIPHAGVRLADFLQPLFAPPRDDYLFTAIVKRFS